MSAIRCGAYTISLDHPRIVGILNVTPDSFSDGGRFFDPARAVAHALSMAREGADIIDIGGESTRPGSIRVSADEELRRILPVLDALADELAIPISLDTSKPEVADACLARMPAIINDVYGLRDPAMREVIARHQAPVIIMHMQGTPDTMQKNPSYGDVVEEVIGYLGMQAQLARAAGIEQIIIDPGIGFGKTITHNLLLLKHLDRFKRLGYPLMVGVSRKSFLQKILGAGSDDVLEGTLAASVIAAYNGADLIRVHDVAAVRRALAVANAIRNA